MKLKDGKITTVEESKLEILQVTGKGIDRNGREVIRGDWTVANGEINLGSVANPNKNIMSFKYTVEAERPSWLKEFFGK